MERLNIIDFDAGIESYQEKPDKYYLVRLDLLKEASKRGKKYAWLDTGRMMSIKDYEKNYLEHDSKISYNNFKLLGNCKDIMRYGGCLIIQLLDTDLCVAIIIKENEQGIQKKVFQKKTIAECEELLYNSIKEFI